MKSRDLKKKIKAHKKEIRSLRKASSSVQQHCSGPALSDADGYDEEAPSLEGKVEALEELLKEMV